MSGVLIDTSVWVDHFRIHNDILADLLVLDLALTHPMIVVELACGTPPAPRIRTLTDIATLPQARQANLGEVRELIEREQLYGLGCGLVDLTLLASTLLTPGSKLWTRDKRLVQLAERFGIAYQSVRH
ncbi:VapC toxin family PIN domain ribonuclease [Massilia niastensis]|uniref:VapC toxin family PIN domain ribonuclease n=1 Tax=Massilia niastensis TaxID=544911 RepID=UPI0009FC615C|nr:VapC toxin family PIN domain ribonuclease [Massilia niastensis]